MKDIIEAGNLPEGEKVYLKKDRFGWRVVNPIKDPETGKLNWFNLVAGGKRNLFILIFLLIIASFLFLGINELVGNYKIIAESPCDYCESCAAASIGKSNIGSWNNLEKFVSSENTFNSGGVK